jgi:hypothetical protein
MAIADDAGERQVFGLIRAVMLNGDDVIDRQFESRKGLGMWQYSRGASPFRELLRRVVD